MMDRPGLVDAANSDTDMLTAAASVARLDLVADAGALSVGVDAADTIQASNSLEKMLAQSWLGLFEQFFRFDKWNACRVQAAAICDSRLK